MDVRSLFSGFSTYLSVGFLNTLIHWSVFWLLHGALTVRQVFSNSCAFAMAATFSFYANARYTFKSNVSFKRYLLFIGFMGLMSFGVGWMGDWMVLPGLITLAVFSGISLIGGFFYSKKIVFGGEGT